MLEREGKILDNMERYVSLSDKERDAFLRILDFRTVKKRQFIVQPGFVCTHQTYVVKGAMRAYFMAENGSEHTIQLAIDDWFISDFNSYINQKPASLYVEALTTTEILEFNFEQTEKLCETYPVFERFFRIVAQKSFAFAQGRILSNIGKTAKERYLEFCDTYPEMIQRIPQYALASYLGMTPEFMSKLKKELLT